MIILDCLGGEKLSTLALPSLKKVVFKVGPLESWTSELLRSALSTSGTCIYSLSVMDAASFSLSLKVDPS